MTRYILNDEEEALYRRSQRVIAPSRYGQEFWEGRYAEGARFTHEQLYAMRVRGLDAERSDWLHVVAAGQPGRIYLTQPGIFMREIVYFYRRLACPIVGKRGDRLRVIAPNGAEKLVYADGSLTRSRARRAA